MAKPILDRPGVVSSVGQGVAAAVAQHVGMHLEIEASAFAKAFNVPVHRVWRERPTPLGREYKGAVGKLPPKLPQCPNLIASQRMHGRLAVLDPAHVQRSRAAELDLRPFQIANLGSPQAMPEGDEDQGGVAVAVAAVTGGLDQLLYLRQGQVFAGRSSALAGRTGTDRFSLLGVTNRSCAFIGLSRPRKRLTDKYTFSGQSTSLFRHMACFFGQFSADRPLIKSALALFADSSRPFPEVREVPLNETARAVERCAQGRGWD